MGAGGDLGHDTSEAGVQVLLAENCVRKDLARTGASTSHDRRRGLVAARLDAEDRQRLRHAARLRGPCRIARGRSAT
jgi:hypothetical protein